MAQIQIRDPQGAPIRRINIRLALGDQSSDAAYDDRFTDNDGNTAWPNPLPSPTGYSLYVNDRNVDARYGTATVLVPSLADDIPITLSAAPLARLRVAGQRFVTDAGPVFLRGASMFTLYQRFLDGGDVRPQLACVRSYGANAIRVFGMFHYINVNEFSKPAFTPQGYGDRFYDQTPAFCQLAAEYGLYVYWSAFPDNDLIMPTQADRRRHFDRWVPALESEPNTLFELTNEQDAHAFNRVDAALFPKPGQMASCAGSYGDIGGPMPGPYWDFLDYHSPRYYPAGIKDCCVADHPNFLKGAAVLLGEPDRFGSNGNPRTEQARQSAGTALGTALGIVFHSRNGLRGEVFDDVTRACADAFFGPLLGV